MHKISLLRGVMMITDKCLEVMFGLSCSAMSYTLSVP